MKTVENKALMRFYRKELTLPEHDANLELPFEDGKFKTIFSNILYWLDDPQKTLKEIYRVLAEDGRAILCIPNTIFFEYCFTYQWKEKKSELLRLLNRGRSECMHHAFSYNDFKALTQKVGFEVIDHFYYLSPLTLKIWDIGLRPLSPYLIKMANGLTPENRKTIKKEWIDTMMAFLLPLYEMENKSKDEGGFHLFVLNKT